uniref:F-box associated domain-containing protein n=1 Tax=Triticum urartu TaxID=4572 RepID=A0A8R7U202_TRIUA
MFTRPILFRGSLHWQILKSAGNMLKVFNTTVESFRQMRAPLLPYPADLFEMDGMLSMFSFDEATNTTIDIWMSQDYDNEVWALKYRVKLPVADLTVRFGKFVEYWNFMVTSRDGDVSMLVKFGEWLLQFDI